MEQTVKNSVRDVPYTSVSISDFISQRQEEIKEANQQCRDAYIRVIKKELSHWASSVKESDTCPKSIGACRWIKACNLISTSLKVTKSFKDHISDEEDLAEDLLDGTANLDDAKDLFRQGHEGEHVFGTVKNAITEFHELFEEAFLLLNVPKEQDLSYELEKDARDLQLQSFYNSCVCDRDHNKYPAMPGTVHKYEEIIGMVKSFFGCLATKSKRATIVYNGHGKCSGELVLQHEQNAPNNTKFLKDLHSLWSELKKAVEIEDGKTLILPPSLTVVFAHCYSFMHFQEPQHRDAINVVSLATPGKPETQYNYELDDSRRYVTSSHHIELDQYARQHSDSSNSETSSLPDTSIDVEPSQSGMFANSTATATAADMFIPSLLLGISLDTSLKLDEQDSSRHAKGCSLPTFLGIQKTPTSLQRSKGGSPDIPAIIRWSKRVSSEWLQVLHKSNNNKAETEQHQVVAASDAPNEQAMNELTLEQPNDHCEDTKRHKNKSRLERQGAIRKKDPPPPSALKSLVQGTLDPFST